MTVIKASAVTFTERSWDFANSLSWTQYTIDPTTIKPHEVIVRALTTSVNPSDLGIIGGGYGTAPKLRTEFGTAEPVRVGGNETLLRVEYVGSAITNFKVGDWVIPKSVGFGSWRSYAVVDTEEDPTVLVVVSSDDDKDFTLEQGATIMINPSTAYQILYQFISDWDGSGNDWIIQNAGNSQVAKYLTQFAKLINVKTISVVRDGKSQQEFDELYQYGATHVVNESDFLSDDFTAVTLPKWIGENGRVRLALNSIGGDTTRQLVNSLSQDGYFVTFGMIGRLPITYDGGVQLHKNITTKSYWLTANTLRDPEGKVATIKELLKLYRAGKIQNVPFEKNYFVAGKDDLKAVFLQAIERSKKGKQVVVYE
ncbi:mitochondrial 2-enoyl thioester reductase [Scheffersomyces amazonensis]|uniref:mitochondrial 2-enoyl thioester reductase n=1 Tax=Scheffersomyces amazonensis TaxID=1078765 RepID=UPI00315CEE3B